MSIDVSIAKKITKTNKYIEAKYPQYFQSEIQPFINEKWFPKYDRKHEELNKNEWVKDFYEKRKEGENDSQICKLIRNDMITELVAYITKNSISLDAKIQPSVYETK